MHLFVFQAVIFFVSLTIHIGYYGIGSNAIVYVPEKKSIIIYLFDMLKE